MTGFGFGTQTSTGFGIGMNTQTTASPFGNNYLKFNQHIDFHKVSNNFFKIEQYGCVLTMNLYVNLVFNFSTLGIW